MEKNKILLIDGYYIEIVPRNYVLHWVHDSIHPKTKEKVTTDSVIGYYGTMVNLIEHFIRTHQENEFESNRAKYTHTLDEYVEFIKESNERTFKAIQDCFKGISNIPPRGFSNGDID